MKKFKIKLTVLSLFILFTLLSCKNSDSNLPATQVEFEKARNDFYESYDKAINQIKKSEIYVQSGQYTCEFEKTNGRTSTDWVGEIDAIVTEKGGDETYLKITSKSQGRKIYYIEESITKDSPMYKLIAEFEEGDKVIFSFRFQEEYDSEKGCFVERSATEYGSLDEPEFEVNFSNIKKLEE